MKMDKLLYHGTSAAFLNQIRQHGIVPRSTSKCRNKWSKEAHSDPDIVYLTDGYPWHFANVTSGDLDNGLVLEIATERLDASLFRADEDYIAQTTMMGEGWTGDVDDFLEMSWEEINKLYKNKKKFLKLMYQKAREDAKEFPELTGASLANLGTLAYLGNIPWSAITRYVIIDWRKVEPMYLRRLHQADIADPENKSLTCVGSYRICGKSHRQFTGWLFGDPVNDDEMLQGFYPNQELSEARAEMERGREGLTVCSVQELDTAA